MSRRGRSRWRGAVATAIALVAVGLVLAVVLALLRGDEPATEPGRETGAEAGTTTPASPVAPSPTATAVPPRPIRPERPPLHGRVVVIDPGHQLGNHNFPGEINTPVDAGGLRKPCNTTGTASDAGLPEATFTWEVAQELRRILEGYGARVLMTRSTNSASDWGPCVDERGRAGNPDQPGPTADLKLSIHADGNLEAGAHGFHVIAPGTVPGYTEDIEDASLELATAVRDALVDAGFEPSTYLGDGGVDIRTDLGTLNLADIPTVMIEAGNMRDAGDAAVMESAAGRRTYAKALAKAVRTLLSGAWSER